MADVKIVKGEIFADARGKISSLNNFRFDGVGRVYFLHHPDVSVLRGWNGHKLEKKWFYCVNGAFTIGLVEIDNWTMPSKDLKVKIHHLTDAESQILCVPEGYASCIKAEIPDSTLMVLSGKTLQEAIDANDNWKFDKDYWSLES